MINVSAEFKELMKTRTDFRQYAEITLTDGAVWALDDSDFRITSNSINDSAGTNELPLGVVVGRTMKMTFQNMDDQFKNAAFLGAKIRLYLTFQLSETVERVELGLFTVISPEDYGDTISIQATDDSWKLDTEYVTDLPYPQTVGAVFRDICNRCGVLFESATFRNYDFVIESKPDNGVTNREMVGHIAMIAGGNARFNRYGRLEILTYEFPSFTIEGERDYDGGTFEGWTEGDALDGGNFTDWASGDNADGGAFNPWTSSGTSDDTIITDRNTHVLSQWINLKPFTEDIVITGVQTIKTVEDNEGNEIETPVMYGAAGYVLSIENPLIAGKEETALALIGDVLVGARIRSFEGEYIGYPLAEFMDKAVLVDRKGNAASTVLTDINFNFFGITTMKNSAAPPLRLSSKYNNAAAQAIIAAKDLVKKEKTQRELAIEKLTATLGGGSGLFPTEESQPDGSTITYLHNKPTLAESDTILVLTSEGIGISTDYGKTYTTGLLFSGDAVLKTLAAEGISADWIDTGALVIRDTSGTIIFEADVKNRRLTISTEYFSLDSNGNITATGGTIGGFTIDGSKLYTQNRTDPLGRYVPGVTLDGQSGVISVGAVSLTGNSSNVGKFGTDNAYVIFNEAAGVLGFTGEASFDDGAAFNDAVTFYEGVKFWENPEFPEPLSVPNGGTGKTSFSANAVLVGNGSNDILAVSSFSGALYATEQGGYPRWDTLPIKQGGTGATSASSARNNFGIYAGSTSVNASSSNAVQVWVSLNNASSKVLVATPVYNTSYVLTFKIYGAASTGFYIRLDKVDSAFNGSNVTFNWIAIG